MTHVNGIVCLLVVTILRLGRIFCTDMNYYVSVVDRILSRT